MKSYQISDFLLSFPTNCWRNLWRKKKGSKKWEEILFFIVEVEQHITIMPNPAARRGSMANYAFPELHPKVNIITNPAARRGSMANYAIPELHPKVNIITKPAFPFKPVTRCRSLRCVHSTGTYGPRHVYYKTGFIAGILYYNNCLEKYLFTYDVWCLAVLHLSYNCSQL